MLHSKKERESMTPEEIAGEYNTVAARYDWVAEDLGHHLEDAYLFETHLSHILRDTEKTCTRHAENLRRLAALLLQCPTTKPPYEAGQSRDAQVLWVMRQSSGDMGGPFTASWLAHRVSALWPDAPATPEQVNQELQMMWTEGRIQHAGITSNRESLWRLDLWRLEDKP